MEVFRNVAENHIDIASLSAIKAYFELLYYFTGEGKRDAGLDEKGILKKLSDGSDAHSFPFPEIARNFRLIEENMHTVIIPMGRGKRLESALRRGARSKALLRAIGGYSVQIYEKHCEELYKTGVIERLDEEFFVLRDKTAFDFNTGIAMHPQGGQALFWDA
jgi:hypothetical protein